MHQVYLRVYFFVFFHNVITTQIINHQYYWLFLLELILFLFSRVIAEFQAITDHEPESEPVRFSADSEAPVFTEELKDQVYSSHPVGIRFYVFINLFI